jgi:ribosomal protein L31
MKVPSVVYVPEESREERTSKHCDQIYTNLCENVSHPFFKDLKNKQQIMDQLKQQIDYIYAKRYGKKRIG